MNHQRKSLKRISHPNATLVTYFFNNNYTCDVNSSKEGSTNNSKKIVKFFILLNFIDFLEMGHLRFGTIQPGLIKVAGLKQIKIVKLVKQSHLAN